MKKLIAIMLAAFLMVGCSSSMQKDTFKLNQEIIAAQIEAANKPLIDMTCPDTGCNFKSFVVANPMGASSLRTVATPKSSGEKVLDGVLQFLPVAGQLWLQDRNGQRSLESQRITSDTTLGILGNSLEGAGNLVEQSLGAVPDAVVVDPTVVNPTVIQVPTQVIEQPTIQEPFVLEPTVIQVPSTTTP